MALTVALPQNVEEVYLAQANARGLPVDALVREILIANQPSTPELTVGQGLGLFGSDEDSALLDEVVAIALSDRRRPSKRT